MRRNFGARMVSWTEQNVLTFAGDQIPEQQRFAGCPVLVVLLAVPIFGPIPSFLSVRLSSHLHSSIDSEPVCL